MKSRITIEVDFDNDNEPVIQIISPAESDDVRDKLIQNFLGRLGYTSSWLKLVFSQRHRDGEARIVITAIPPEQLKTEAEIMSKQAELIDSNIEHAALNH